MGFWGRKICEEVGAGGGRIGDGKLFMTGIGGILMHFWEGLFGGGLGDFRRIFLGFRRR